MRYLNDKEISEISGGDWHIDFDFGFMGGGLSGDDTVQDMAAGIGNMYDDAVNAMSDFFTWWDPAGYYGDC